MLTWNFVFALFVSYWKTSCWSLLVSPLTCSLKLLHLCQNLLWYRRCHVSNDVKLWARNWLKNNKEDWPILFCFVWCFFWGGIAFVKIQMERTKLMELAELLTRRYSSHTAYTKRMLCASTDYGILIIKLQSSRSQSWGTALFAVR